MCLSAHPLSAFWVPCLPDKDPEAGVRGHAAVLVLILGGTSMLFSTAAASFHIPAPVCKGFPVSSHPTSTSCFLISSFGSSPRCGCALYCVVDLICISLTIRDIEHLFMCLSAICLFLEKCQFEPFAHFQIGLCSFCC